MTSLSAINPVTEPANDPGWSPARIQAVRRDTPGTANAILLDNAGASPSPLAVYQRMVDHLELERRIGGYAAQRACEEELGAFYGSIATLINANPSEIAFAENATRAWDMAFYGVALSEGDTILACGSEYISNYLAFVQQARRAGARVKVVPDGPDGTIDLGALGALLDDRVKLVSLCHAPTGNGLMNDAAAVGALLRDHPALYALDACQSVGQAVIDVQAIGCDFLSATGRKFLRGPRGTGFLYVAERALNRITPPFADLRSAEPSGPQGLRWKPGAIRFESWEQPIAAKLGLQVAIDYALELGVAAIAQRSGELATYLRAALGEMDRVHVRDRGRRRSALVTFTCDGIDMATLRQRLEQRQAYVAVIEPEEAVSDHAPGGAHTVLRAAPHYFNTESELDAFVELLAEEIRACA